MARREDGPRPTREDNGNRPKRGTTPTPGKSKPEEEGEQHEIVGTVPTHVQLGPNTSLDLGWLNESERRELIKSHTKSAMEIGNENLRQRVEAESLRENLHVVADHVERVSQQGNSVTLTHTQTTSTGRTEAIMGNTNHAERGRLSNSQTGEKDWTPYYILGGIVAVVVVVIAVAG